MCIFLPLCANRPIQDVTVLGRNESQAILVQSNNAPTTIKMRKNRRDKGEKLPSNRINLKNPSNETIK